MPLRSLGDLCKRLLVPLSAVDFLQKSLFLKLALQVGVSLGFSRSVFFFLVLGVVGFLRILNRTRPAFGCSLIGLVSPPVIESAGNLLILPSNIRLRKFLI